MDRRNSYTQKDEFYEKLNDLLTFSKKHNAEKTKNYILNQFQGESFTKKTIINEVYYMAYDTDIYFKDKNGIHISIHEGPDDMWNGYSSHTGIDISLNNIKFNSIDLFIEDKRIQNRLTLSEIFEPVSKEDVINYLQNNYTAVAFVYKSLSNDFKKDPEIMQLIYDKLKSEAMMESQNERSYSDISPYGGLDVYVHEWQDHFVEKLNDFRDGDNESFVRYAEKQFLSHTENRDYLNQEIKRHKRLQYIVEHQNEYEQKYEIDKTMMHIEDEKYDLKKRLVEVNNDLFKLESEESTLHSTLNRLNKGLFSRVLNSKQIQKIQDELDGIKTLIEMNQSDIAKLTKESNILTAKSKQLENTKPQLKYPFDYLIKNEFVEFYEYYDNFEDAMTRMECFYDESKEISNCLNEWIKVEKDLETSKNCSIHHEFNACVIEEDEIGYNSRKLSSVYEHSHDER